MGLGNNRSFAERIKSLSLEEKIQKEIFETGLLIDNQSEFEKRASFALEVIRKDNIPNLIDYLVNPMKKASYFKSKFSDDKKYISVIHDSVFEILYNYREDAISYLKDLAFDSSIAISIRAMKTLCRLAQGSIDKSNIVMFIDENIDDLRYEVIISSFYFMALIKDSDTIFNIFDRFFHLYHDDCEEYTDALYVLESIYKYDKLSIDPYMHFIKDYALNRNFRNRPDLEGIVLGNIFGEDTDEMNFLFSKSAGEVNNIRAALLYSKIVPDDEEIYKSLCKWYDSISDLNLKNKIEVAMRKFSSIKVREVTYEA